MTANTNGQSSCQNEGCKELRKKIVVVSELLRNAQAVLNDISSGESGCKAIANSRLPSNAEPVVSSVDSGNDIQSDIDDGEDSTKSSEVNCPHANCVGKVSYARMSALRRHFSSHLACNERCLICGVSSTVIRDYILHFEKCKKKADLIMNKHALKGTQRVIDRLQIETRQKLEEMHESRTALDRVDVDSEANGTKRRADFFEHPSRRRCIQIDDCARMPDASFAQAEASTSRASMDYSNTMQLNFPCNSTAHPINTSWDTYRTGNDEGSLCNIPGSIMYRNDLGIPTQDIYQKVEEGNTLYDAPILRKISAPRQYSWPQH